MGQVNLIKTSLFRYGFLNFELDFQINNISTTRLKPKV
jgi:hypothetical protein